jgi:hypothetical protein
MRLAASELDAGSMGKGGDGTRVTLMTSSSRRTMALPNGAD